MSGHVHWLKDLNDESYALLPSVNPPRVLIERSAFESIGDYTESKPTHPSPGRVYRKNFGWPPAQPDNWYLYICVQDPVDPEYVLHHSYRVDLVDDPVFTPEEPA